MFSFKKEENIILEVKQINPCDKGNGSQIIAGFILIVSKPCHFSIMHVIIAFTVTSVNSNITAHLHVIHVAQLFIEGLVSCCPLCTPQVHSQHFSIHSVYF